MKHQGTGKTLIRLTVTFFLLSFAQASAAELLMAMTSEKETLEFSSSDIAEARAENDDQTNIPFVAFRLTREGRQKLTEFNERHLNQQVKLIVCGEVVSSPFIREPIRGGSGVVGNVLTNNQAEALARKLNLGVCD